MWQQEFTRFFALFHQESCSAIKDEGGYPQKTMEGAHRWGCK